MNWVIMGACVGLYEHGVGAPEPRMYGGITDDPYLAGLSGKARR